MLSKLEASSKASGEPAATQPRTQPAGKSARGNSTVQGQTVGARAAVRRHAIVPVDSTGNTTQGVELPAEPVLPMRVSSDVRVGDYMPAWLALLLLNGSDCQAAGLHVDECEGANMADVQVPGA